MEDAEKATRIGRARTRMPGGRSPRGTTGGMKEKEGEKTNEFGSEPKPPLTLLNDTYESRSATGKRMI